MIVTFHCRLCGGMQWRALRKRHMKAKGEQQQSWHGVMYCLSLGQYWLANVYFRALHLLINCFAVHDATAVLIMVMTFPNGLWGWRIVCCMAPGDRGLLAVGKCLCCFLLLLFCVRAALADCPDAHAFGLLVPGLWLRADAEWCVSCYSLIGVKLFLYVSFLSLKVIV